jgi:hypothetical protein
MASVYALSRKIDTDDKLRYYVNVMAALADGREHPGGTSGDICRAWAATTVLPVHLPRRS